MMEKIIPELSFLTKEDILNLCNEAQKPTELGKLAVISLENIVSILDKKQQSFIMKLLIMVMNEKNGFFLRLLLLLSV